MKDITFRMANKPYYSGPHFIKEWEEISLNLSTDLDEMKTKRTVFTGRKRFSRKRSTSRSQSKVKSSEHMSPNSKNFKKKEVEKENKPNLKTEGQRIVLSPAKISDPKKIMALQKKEPLSRCQNSFQSYKKSQNEEICHLQQKLSDLENIISNNLTVFKEELSSSRKNRMHETNIDRSNSHKCCKHRLIDRILKDESINSQAPGKQGRLVDQNKIRYIPMLDILQYKGGIINNPKLIKERLMKKYELELAWHQI